MLRAVLAFVPKGTAYRDDDEKVAVESRNGVIQAQFVLHTIAEWNDGTKVTPELLRKLQELAVTQIYRCAGYFRDGPVELRSESDTLLHEPPDASEVEQLVAEMCDYVNDNWSVAPAIHLAAYVMWRLNWIHPFFGGNGRTSRAFSYLVLSAKLGFMLPGKKTIPELIVASRTPYYDALRSADAALLSGRVDVREMEALIGSLLAAQLVQIHHTATGKIIP